MCACARGAGAAAYETSTTRNPGKSLPSDDFGGQREGGLDGYAGGRAKPPSPQNPYYSYAAVAPSQGAGPGEQVHVPAVLADRHISREALQLGEQLGGGSFGPVYKATLDGREAVVKTLELERARKLGLDDDEALAALYWEGVSLALSDHPSLVALLGVCVAPNFHALVLEYCGGGTLADPRKSVTWSTTWRRLMSLGEGLRYLHVNGQVHRDIRPSNVRVTPAGDVKWANFGRVKAVSERASRGGNARDLCWSAPEDVRAARGGGGTNPPPPSTASDIFSFGLLMYQQCVGRKQWWPAYAPMGTPGPGQQMTPARILRGLEDPAVRQLDMPIDDAWPLAPLLRRCLDDDPARRPTAEEVVQALIALAPVCFDSERAAFRAVVQMRNQWYLFPSAAERAGYQVPLTTDLQHESRRKGRHASPLTAQVDLFLRDRSCSTLVLLADGGLGKTLSAQHIAAAAAAAGDWQPILLREVLPTWTWDDLENGAQRAVAWYGLHDGLRFADSMRILFILDGLDEVPRAATEPQNIPLHLGLYKWPLAKLIVTSRREALDGKDLSAAFAIDREPSAAMDEVLSARATFAVRYLLPFTRKQSQNFLIQRGVPVEHVAAIIAQDPLRNDGVIENPYLLQLFAAHWRAAEWLAVGAGGQRLQRRHVFEAALAARFESAVAAEVLPPTVVARLLGARGSGGGGDDASSEATASALFASFKAFIERMAYTIFARDAQSLTIEQFVLSVEPWLRVPAWIDEDARQEFRSRGPDGNRIMDERDLVAFRRRTLQAFMRASPLFVDMAGQEMVLHFTHRLLREHLAAAYIASRPHAATDRLITREPSVQRLLAEFVNVDQTDIYIRRLVAARTLPGVESPRASGIGSPVTHGLPPPGLGGLLPESPADRFGVRAVEILLESRDAHEGDDPHMRAIAACNCITALNTAGVAFSGLDLRGLPLGIAAHGSREFVADLSGAMLAGTNLERANLAHCLLARACLDGAMLTGCDLRGAYLGEVPALLLHAATCLAVSPDGRTLFSSHQETISQNLTAERKVGLPLLSQS
jgi:serine/threonine protein kinase